LEKKPTPTDNVISNDAPSNFYFIKNSEGIYVAIIQDRNNDLHWFVLKNYRKQGYLTKALKETVLFHLFQDREEQRITIVENAIGKQNFIASERVALKLGFIKGEENTDEYFLKKEMYENENFIEGINTPISDERMKVLTKKINYLALSLWQIQNEIEMSYGEIDYSIDLKELVKMIKSNTVLLEDVIWENKEQFK